MENFRMLCIWVSLTFYMSISNSLDTITPSQFIRDGDNTLVSGSGTFELGFFSPGNSSTRRYLGVWYKNISPPKVVWVANRETPVSKISGVLQISENGVLLLLNAANTTVWSSNVSSKAENPIAQLLDSGNLIVRNENDHNSENYLWQSFDYPCDTLLPGMKLGLNLVTGLNRYISSWKTEDDPAQGEYTEKIDPRGYPQVVFMTGSVIKTRVGSWNGLSFTGYPILPKTYRYEFVLNEKEVYFVYELLDSSVFSMVKMSPFGIGQRFLWSCRTRSWQTSTIGQADQCENYGLCGANSICDMNGNSANCACLKGFAPKVPEEWDMSFWSNGCVRNIGLDCNEEQDGFWKYRNMKLPDTSSSWFSKTVKPEECRKSCLQNCSCAAYASLDIRSGGSGCLQWFGNLIDMRRIPHEGQDLFIRLHPSELVAYNGHGNIRKKVIEISVGSTIVIMGIIIFGLTTYVRKKKLKFPVAGIFYSNRTKTKEAMDLPTYDLSIIAKATDNFSSNNKLGEGGFGPVCKGILLDRQEVAVKRLARKSGQGFEEFKNEVVLIAKLQHRNLVKLLGCCIEGEEKILIYEYMANKSLDFFIFDEDRSKLLDWPTRLSIISGIARELLYLHQDSTLRIIHRDLKTSNILLDANLNPKISDFGLARTFLGEQVEANTNKVAGTYGYMPPEYAMRGHFSMKSDVFSFGVIVLEIISGKKNREFSDSEQYLNLLGHAWRLWTEGRALDLVDKMLGERFIPCEVIRCIHVGLLCVQQIPEERPSMSNVILMLNGEKTLPKPKVPGFYTQRDNILEADHSLSARCQLFSPNEMSLTKFEAR